MANENFTTYTEVDPGGNITVTSSTVTWTDLSSREDDSYVYYDFGASYFSGDFTHKFVINVSDMDTSIAFWFPWALANSVNDLKAVDNAGESFIAFGLHNTGTFDMYLYVCESGNLSTDNSVNLSLNTDYYITITRDDDAGAGGNGRIKAYVCTGAHYGQGGTLIDTLQYDWTISSVDFRYLYATNIWDTDMSNKDISGTVSDMSLKASVSTTTTSTTSTTTSTSSSTSSTASTTSSTSSTSSTASTSSTSSTASTTSSTSSTSSTASTSSTSSTSSTASTTSSTSSTSSTASTTSSTSSTASTTSSTSSTSSTASTTSTTTTAAPEGSDSEIHHNYTTGFTLYACRFRTNGSVFVTDGSASEPWGTGSRDADDYDVQMTEQGTASGHYTCQFDASSNISAGVYHVAVYLQAGANPVDSDIVIGQGEIYWDGTSEITLYDIDVDGENLKQRLGPWY